MSNVLSESNYFSATPGPGEYLKEKSPRLNKLKIEDSKYYSERELADH